MRSVHTPDTTNRNKSSWFADASISLMTCAPCLTSKSSSGPAAKLYITRSSAPESLSGALGPDLPCTDDLTPNTPKMLRRPPYHRHQPELLLGNSLPMLRQCRYRSSAILQPGIQAAQCAANRALTPIFTGP